MAKGAAFALLLAALALRLLVPAGFMPVFDAHGVRIVPCSGHGPMIMAMPMPMPGGHGHAPKDDSARDDGACGFSALGEAAIGGGAPVALLAIAIAYVLARGVRPRAVPVPWIWRLRPPLRAPPA